MIAKKYEVTPDVLAAELTRPDILQPDPLAVLIFCVRHRITSIARSASKEILIQNIDLWAAEFSERAEADLKHIPFWTLKRFDKLRQNLNEGAAKIITKRIITEPADGIPERCVAESCYVEGWRTWMNPALDQFKASKPLAAATYEQNFGEDHLSNDAGWTRHYNPCLWERLEGVYGDVEVMLDAAIGGQPGYMLLIVLEADLPSLEFDWDA